MSTNVSKQKRENLLAKIKAIRTYIATAPQDENTANLLAYLSELEKDVGAKKYGLVFEEHREEIAAIAAFSFFSRAVIFEKRGCGFAFSKASI